MSSEAKWAYMKPTSPPEGLNISYTPQQRIVSSLILLIFGYYTLNVLGFWPSTTKRAITEWLIYLFPSRLIYLLERLLRRYSHLLHNSPAFELQDFGNQRAKSAALHRMYAGIREHVNGVAGGLSVMSGTPGAWRPKTGVPLGLGNNINYCFQNSILQGFNSLPAFKAFIDRKGREMANSKVAAPTTITLGSFMNELDDISGTHPWLWAPKNLQTLGGWEQQDAQEYFSNILDWLDKEASSTKPIQPGPKPQRKRKFEDFRHDEVEGLRGGNAVYSRNTTVAYDGDGPQYGNFMPSTSKAAKHRPGSVEDQPLLDPLIGKQAQIVMCTSCGFSEGLKVDPFNCLTVNLGGGSDASISQLLDEYTAPEEIEGVECSNCTAQAEAEVDGDAQDRVTKESSGEANPRLPASDRKTKPVYSTKRKQITIGRLPQDLVLHINRSLFDPDSDNRKNVARVSFPPKLDFVKKWCADIGSGDEVQPSYALRCVVTHHGRHNDGHYMAWGRRDQGWYLFNDACVTPVDVKEVLDRGDVTMLFYEALDQPGKETKMGDSKPEPKPEGQDTVEVEKVVIDLTSDSSEDEACATNLANTSPETRIAEPAEPITVLRTASATDPVPTDPSLSPTCVPTLE